MEESRGRKRRRFIVGVAAATTLALPAIAGAGVGGELIVRAREVDIEHRGAPETFRVPAGVTSVTVDACGAQGAATTGTDGVPLPTDFAAPGAGAFVVSALATDPGETLVIRAGGAGSTDGGYNGGGRSTVGPFFDSGAGGGGATDLRQGGDGLDDRVVIAGGGGGGGLSVPSLVPFPPGLLGGGNGGLLGQDAVEEVGGRGGTATAGGEAGQGGFSTGQPGALGVGGSSDDSAGAGGGGGGLYGGGAGTVAFGHAGGGGGGSSLADEVTDGACTGDGWARLSFEEPLSVLPGGFVAPEPGEPTIHLVPVRLSFAVDEPVEIHWRTRDLDEPGLVRAGEDYVSGEGTVTIPPGDTEASFPLVVLPDGLAEPALLWGEWGVIDIEVRSGNALVDDTVFFGSALFIIVDDD